MTTHTTRGRLMDFFNAWPEWMPSSAPMAPSPPSPVPPRSPLEPTLRDSILMITILVAFLEATAQQLRPYNPPAVMTFRGHP